MKYLKSTAPTRMYLALAVLACLSLVSCNPSVDPKPSPTINVPGIPGGLYIEPSGNDTALIWASVSGADDYCVYFSNDDGSYAAYASMSGTEYLLPKYGYYKVSARNTAGESALSAAVYHELPAGDAVAIPVFTPIAGEFDAPQEIAIATTTTGATIYYTTDGSTPSIGNSEVYSATISVSTGEELTITAIAAYAGYANSDAAVGTFRVHGWSVVGSAGFSGGAASDIAIAVSTIGTPSVVFRDDAAPHKATAMQYVGSSWMVLGTAGFSSAEAYYTSIALDSQGSAYVSFFDGSENGEATVEKFDGSAWSVLGVSGFSAGTFIHTSLVVRDYGSSHIPYVAYQDGGNSLKATVMKYDGAWSPLGTAGFTADTVEYVSLALAGDGTPYIGFKDYSNTNKATVMKFESGAWNAVGAVGFSAGAVDYVSLSISGDGTPVIAFKDGANAGKVTVMKYDAGGWNTVGSAGISAGIADYVSLAAISDAALRVAFKDGSQGGKATLLGFDGTNWTTIGNAGFSAGSAEYLDFALDGNGTPFVSFKDGANSGKVTVMVYR